MSMSVAQKWLFLAALPWIGWAWTASMTLVSGVAVAAHVPRDLGRVRALHAGVDRLVCLGCATAVAGAWAGLCQTDLKRVIAFSFSTMVAACGLLRDGVSVFHLLSHATLKAGLFLGAGVVLMGADSHSTGLGGGQDVRQGGGFGSGVSGGALCWGAMLVSSLGLSGFPGLTGASSKDSILQAGVWSLDCGSFAVPMLAGSVCATGAYLARLLWGAHLSLFGGRLAATPHESSAQSELGAGDVAERCRR